MPIILIILGALIAVSSIQDTHRKLWRVTSGAFTGKDNFIYWVIALVAVGAVGYVGTETGKLRNFSVYFMILIIIVMLLSNNKDGKNFFEMFMQEIEEGTTKEAAEFGAPLVESGGSNPNAQSNLESWSEKAGTALKVASFF